MVTSCVSLTTNLQCSNRLDSGHAVKFNFLDLVKVKTTFILQNDSKIYMLYTTFGDIDQVSQVI